MAKIEFKTNINCSSCVRSVTNFLNEVPGLESWEVDTGHPDKILRVSGEVEEETVIEAVEDAGFEISNLK